MAPTPLRFTPPRSGTALLVVIALFLGFAGCRGNPSSPFGLTSRAFVPSLGFPTGVSPVGEVEIVRAFPALTFTQPVLITFAPDGTDRLFVVEKPGTIRVFDNDDAETTSTVFLSIAVDDFSEQGLLGLAFSPDYATTGEFYVYYTAPTGNRRSVLSRFTVSADPDVADPTSEEILLEIDQPFPNHNAGMLAFGPDGFLYVSLGDGGSAGDPFGHGQNLTTLLGNLLRIDPRGGVPYAIPPDNPYVGGGGGVREEIYASGLRNPWRFSFDRATGDLWLGDVGQNTREEVNLVALGENLGWDVYEGNLPFENPGGLPPTAFRAPVLDYDVTEGESVTGGVVYRGGDVPSLSGIYVYGDYVSGRVWGLQSSGGVAVANTRIGTLSNVVAFGEDRDGEVYLLSIAGTIWRFAESSTPSPPLAAPTQLSQTGIFSDLATLTVAPGLIAYEVQAEEWADGAEISRWLFVPGDDRITFHPTDDWQFPVGTVAVKHFEIERFDGSRRRLETRAMVREVGQWAYYTYVWDPLEIDAELELDGHDETVTVETATGPLTFDYHVPSTAQCAGCHAGGPGRLLGVRTAQLNRFTVFPENGVDNQIRAWNHIGLFTTDVGDGAGFAAFPDPTSGAVTLAERARIALEVNCASCHRPGGTAPGALDLRYHTALADRNAVGVAPSAGDLGIPGAVIIAAGDRGLSVLFERLLRLDATRMPEVRRRVDLEMAEEVGAWIDGL